MRPCHEFPFSGYHSSKKQVYIPISSKPIDPECDKTASLVSSLSFFFASFNIVWYYLGDGSFICTVLFYSSLHLLYYSEGKKSTRSQGFILPSKWGIDVVNCRICLERCFSSTTVTLYTGEEFRNTLSCNGNSSVGCSHPVLLSIVWRLNPLSKCPLYLLYSTYFWKHFKAAFLSFF